MVDLERAAALGQLASHVEIARKTAVPACVHVKNLLEVVARLALQDEPRPGLVNKQSGGPSCGHGLAQDPNTTRAGALAKDANRKTGSGACAPEHSISSSSRSSFANHAGSIRAGTEAQHPISIAAGCAGEAKDSRSRRTRRPAAHAVHLACSSAFETVDGSGSIRGASCSSVNAINGPGGSGRVPVHPSSTVAGARRRSIHAKNRARRGRLIAAHGGGTIGRAVRYPNDTVDLTGRGAFAAAYSSRKIRSAIGRPTNAKHVARGRSLSSGYACGASRHARALAGHPKVDAAGTGSVAQHANSRFAGRYSANRNSCADGINLCPGSLGA